MKSICPHCFQKYDISEGYFQREVACGNCGQNFIALKARFCKECGTVNHSKSLKCRQCRKKLTITQPITDNIASGNPAFISNSSDKTIPDLLSSNPKPHPDIANFDRPIVPASPPSLHKIRTVCPHCYQNYDISPDSLQQEAVCENCQNNFVVTRAEPCSKCGFLNPPQASNCGSCQKPFQIEFKKEPEPQSTYESNPIEFKKEPEPQSTYESNPIEFKKEPEPWFTYESKKENTSEAEEKSWGYVLGIIIWVIYIIWKANQS